MRQSQSFSIHGDPGKLRSGCPYAEYHELVSSVMRRREDSCDVVVSVASVSEDVGEDDFLSSIVCYIAYDTEPCTEGNVYKENFL